MDLICCRCGESWDHYGITIDRGNGDLTAGEARRFLRGEGCPACDFGANTHVLSAQDQAALLNQAIYALLDATDEEPIGVLDTFLKGV